MTDLALPLPDHIDSPPLTLGRLAWFRFRRHRMALIGIGLLALLVLYCTVGALFFTEKFANFNDTGIALQPP